MNIDNGLWFVGGCIFFGLVLLVYFSFNDIDCEPCINPVCEVCENNSVVCEVTENFTGLVGRYVMQDGEVTSLRCKCDENSSLKPYCCDPTQDDVNLLMVENGVKIELE